MKYPLWISDESVGMYVRFQLLEFDSKTEHVTYKEMFKLSPREIKLLVAYLRELNYVN